MQELKNGYEVITPERAKQLLERNDINRRLRPVSVEAYARDIENGRWGKNQDPIAISKSGRLLNGQHRLSAIIKANKAVEMLVSYDVDDKCIFDTAIQRTAGDEIAIGGKVETEFSKSEYVAIARFMVGEALNKRKGGKKVTNAEIENYIYENICYFRKLKIATTGNKKMYFNTVPVRTAMYSAVKAGIDPNILHDFWKVLVYGFQSSETDNPIIAYRNYIMGMTSRSRITWDEVIKRGQYAIREYLNKTEKKRSVNPGDFIYPLE